MHASQKETPASGSNHTAGVNTQNTAGLSVIAQHSASSEPGAQYVHDLAQVAAAKRLAQAATFAAFHTKKPLFEKRMGKGAAAVLVRFEWPGVLAVYDPDTGEAYARSIPGQPATLQKI